ncbi:MAG: hypothetical protein NW241_14060 [Bacteroidia bacterium]|nr:hypothetical protein [Bacteroidia bacterium]
MAALLNVYRFGLLCLAMLLLSQCAPPPPDQTLAGTWRLRCFESADGSWMSCEPDHIARPVVIAFDDRGRGGHFDGETVTNYLRGTYRITGPGRVEIRSLDGSLQGEPVWSSQLWEALRTTGGFARSSRTMELRYQQDSLRMIWELQ